MVQGDVKLSLLFGIIFVVFVDGDEFECKLVFVNRFDEKNFAESALSKLIEYFVIMNFVWHHFAKTIDKICFNFDKLI
jgi:hypothetical protein